MKCKQEKLSKRLILAIGLAVLLGGSTYGEAAGHVEPFREDRGIAILAGNAGIVEKMKEYIS